MHPIYLVNPCKLLLHRHVVNNTGEGDGRGFCTSHPKTHLVCHITHTFNKTGIHCLQCQGDDPCVRENYFSLLGYLIFQLDPGHEGGWSLSKIYFVSAYLRLQSCLVPGRVGGKGLEHICLVYMRPVHSPDSVQL